jgi:hypothetical protein
MCCAPVVARIVTEHFSCRLTELSSHNPGRGDRRRGVNQLRTANATATD